MKKLVLVVTFTVSFVAVCAAWGRTLYVDSDVIKVGVEQGLGEILDLWRDGKYDLLYDRTLAGGKQTKERFIDRLSSAPYRPACCWEKLQEVRVTIKNDDSAVIRAKIGLEGATGPYSKTRDFNLYREEGVWRIAQGDLLSLSGASKKKSPHKKKSRVYHSYR